MRLPIDIRPLPDETFMSWANRLSAPYICTPVRLLNHARRSKSSNKHVGDTELFDIFSKYSGFKPEDLVEYFSKDLTHHSILRKSKKADHLWQVKLPRKYCVRCWKSDEDKQTPKYHRQEWLEPWRLVCSIHGTFLTDVSGSTTDIEPAFPKKTNIVAFNKIYASVLRQPEEMNKSKAAILNEFENPAPLSQVAKLHFLTDALSISLLNQKPVFNSNFLNWFSFDNHSESDATFPSYDRNSSVELIDNVQVNLKAEAVNLLAPLAFGYNKDQNKIIAALISKSCPLRDQAREMHNLLRFSNPYQVLIGTIRKDMQREALSFFRSKGNLLAPILEKQLQAEYRYSYYYSGDQLVIQF